MAMDDYRSRMAALLARQAKESGVGGPLPFNVTRPKGAGDDGGKGGGLFDKAKSFFSDNAQNQVDPITGQPLVAPAAEAPGAPLDLTPQASAPVPMPRARPAAANSAPPASPFVAGASPVPFPNATGQGMGAVPTQFGAGAQPVQSAGITGQGFAAPQAPVPPMDFNGSFAAAQQGSRSAMPGIGLASTAPMPTVTPDPNFRSNMPVVTDPNFRSNMPTLQPPGSVAVGDPNNPEEIQKRILANAYGSVPYTFGG